MGQKLCMKMEGLVLLLRVEVLALLLLHHPQRLSLLKPTLSVYKIQKCINIIYPCINS